MARCNSCPPLRSEIMTATKPLGSPHPLLPARPLGWSLVAIPAIGIALYAVPPYAMLDPVLSRIPLNAIFTSHLLWLSLHAVPGGLALILGPFQFLAAVRARWPKAHRLGGKIYLVCILAASAAAIPATIMTTAGFAAQAGFALLIAAWLYSAYQAYRAARQRRFADHRIWMIRNYALTFAAVLLRVFLLAGLALRQADLPISFDQLYIASIWGSIAVSSLAAEWFFVTGARAKAP